MRMFTINFENSVISKLLSLTPVLFALPINKQTELLLRDILSANVTKVYETVCVVDNNTLILRQTPHFSIE